MAIKQEQDDGMNDTFKKLLGMLKTPPSISAALAEAKAEADQKAAQQSAQQLQMNANGLMSGLAGLGGISSAPPYYACSSCGYMSSGSSYCHKCGGHAGAPICPRCQGYIDKYHGCACSYSPPWAVPQTFVPNTPYPSTGYTFSLGSTGNIVPGAAIPPNAPTGFSPEKAALVEKLKSVEARRIQKPVPDFVMTITGWRSWTALRVAKDGKTKLRMGAIGAGLAWEPKKKMEAQCLKTSLDGGPPTEHEAPYRCCSCGMWSFKSMDNLMAAVGGYANIAVVGSVALWGRVIECENGFRAQYAYPTELWLLEPGLEELGVTYGVPVRTEQLAISK